MGIKFCTFGIGICELVYTSAILALSVLGSEAAAYCVISAHHRSAAPMVSEYSEKYRND